MYTFVYICIYNQYVYTQIYIYIYKYTNVVVFLYTRTCIKNSVPARIYLRLSISILKLVFVFLLKFIINI